MQAALRICLAGILITFGVAKLSFRIPGDAFDELLGVDHALVLPLIGGLELFLAASALFRDYRWTYGTIAWLGICFLVYRLFGALLVSDHEGCRCLGSAAKVLGLNDATVNWMSIIAATVLTAGGSVLFFSPDRSKLQPGACEQ